ncbi:MAG TPA: hypothetical protein DCZ95_10460 [Verrucomicrobia bacterium]|nr:MAG: hypothetical protein A2X46_18680 [Lentisphaerae bacterium GWF2_57_35]HBA84504.1 hypothetical protein [Verrucomicrobiota bacterium]
MRVSGLVSYNGCEQTGSIYVLTVMEESSWSVAKSVVLASPSAYTNDEIGNFASYWFKSFLDVNANCLRENWEPHGIYSAYSLYVTTDVSGVNIALNDQPSLWGVVNYSGSVTGNVYVLAVTASNSWQSLYQSVTVWQQGEDLTGGTTFASFPINFSMTELPATSLYVRAFIDANYDGEYSPPEPAGQFSASAIPVSNRVVLGAFTLGEDSDADQMPDWWELMHGFDPGNPADALLDRDSDEAANWKEYLFSINPDNSDSDADGMPDGWEIRYGLTPSVNDASGDMDGDGLSNLDEYKRGANPSNPDSDNDRISDGTNAVGLIYAGADPNPLTPAPGYLPCVETPSYRYLIRMEEDAVGRPIVAWYGMDALGQRHIYVAKWFGQPPEIVGQWAELDGMWEGFGSSLTLNGLVAPSNGTTGFDMALGTDDNPFVIWNDSKGYNARIKSGSDLDKLLF